MKATGKPHSLWVSFARFYEDNEQLDDVSIRFSALDANIFLLAVLQVNGLFCVGILIGFKPVRHGPSLRRPPR